MGVKKKIIFTLSLLGLLVSFTSFVFAGNTKAADHCLETKDCNKNNSYSEKDGYLEGCSWYNVTGTFIINYSCTPTSSTPILACASGQHISNSGPFGQVMCVDDSTPYPTPVVTSGCTTMPSGGCTGKKCTVNEIDYCCETKEKCAVFQDNNKKIVNKLDILCNSGNGIKTAIGCLNVLTDTNTFASQLLGWAVGIGGGIAFLLMLYSGFMIMTAQGNPDRLKAGQELLTSAIAGLILLILSVFILRFIGIDILGLNKFGFGS
jgi:hypothetical protein